MSKEKMSEYKHEKAPSNMLGRLHDRVKLNPGGYSETEPGVLFAIRVRKNRNLVLSLSTCMDCGACLTVCPAYLATRNIRNSPLGRITLAKSIMKGRINDEVINEAYTYFWQCLTCRRCAWACPFGVDVADITRAIRSMLYELNLAPNYVVGVIDNLESTGNFLGLPEDVLKEVIINAVNEIRLEKGVNARVKINEAAYALLLPSACADYTTALNTFKGYVLLLNELGVDFTLSTRAPDITNYGLFMDERHMKLIAERIVEEARRLGVKLVIAGECGHGWRVFKNYVIPRLREYGIEGTHIIYIATEAIKRGLVKLDVSLNDGITYIYMDPCHYARGGDLVKEPRFVLRSVVSRYMELNERPELAICCGGTSGMLAKEMEELSIKYAELWYQSVINKGANCIVVPCAACKLQMDRVLPKLNKLHEREITFTGLMDLVYKAIIPRKTIK
ncbi:(Fe-S)-binding protein [Vulcanisaeta souniana]|uniref:Iron-sulfur protein n=1 Tax=Vulcanisaeta souniana JCM 11219 TaxID=1293586 RepID=A0A830ELI7_9CREN|nr:(Fe-S)-binding protein [Vulcanisaeta souniana]BDR93064.1 iron-sulfur protein [Vulcanisaeta souniana JCM 11219]GGI83166.1 iron-sulfur protein [Vulcanisaeta souniana JCM 11219]